LWDKAKSGWDKVKPNEKGQGQTEYAMIYVSVFIAVLILVGLGAAIVSLFDQIMAALPF
jgi:Flp pilus assembly pilin Flp